jgi:hypothetical protein
VSRHQPVLEIGSRQPLIALGLLDAFLSRFQVPTHCRLDAKAALAF